MDIAKFIIARDGRFQAAERENRKAGSDPHQSFLRTYAYELLPTNSPEFDQMYIDVRWLLDSIGLTEIAKGARLTNRNIAKGGSNLGLEMETVEDFVRFQIFSAWLEKKSQRSIFCTSGLIFYGVLI